MAIDLEPIAENGVTMMEDSCNVNNESGAHKELLLCIII